MPTFIIEPFLLQTQDVLRVLRGLADAMLGRRCLREHFHHRIVIVSHVAQGSHHRFEIYVAAQEVPRVCEAARRGTAEVEPFALEVCGADAFPNARRPRTLWLGVGSGQEEMATLHREVEAPLRKLGFRPEHRRYHPHLTIGRVRRVGPGVAELGQLLEQHADYMAGRVTVAQVVVFSSQLGRGGPKYEVLSRAKLGGK